MKMANPLFGRFQSILAARFIVEEKCSSHILKFIRTFSSEPSYDPDTKIIFGPKDEFQPEKGGLGVALLKGMEKNSYEIAQVETLTGTKEHFGAVLKRSIRTAMELIQRGATSNDIISICSENNLQNAVPFYASQLAGIKLASLDPKLSIEETVLLLKLVKPKFIFVSDITLKLIVESVKKADINTEIVTFGRTKEYTNFTDFIKPKESENTFEPVHVNDLKQTALILFTSGTTGLSKGIDISHYGMLYQANLLATSGLHLNDTLTYATTFWVSTAVVLCLSAIYGKSRIIDAWNPTNFWQMINHHNVTCLFLAAPQAVYLSKVTRKEQTTNSNLKDILIGGSAIHPSHINKLRQVVPSAFIQVMYGQCEATGSVLLFRPNNVNDVKASTENPNSCGRPLFGFQYKVVDIYTEVELGPNEYGHLFYKHDSVMNGYYNAKIPNPFDEEGWIKSGDLVHFDQNLNFYFAERLNEMMNYKFTQISPIEIENVLLQHPAVAEAAVVGIPHASDGEHPMGFVVLHEGSEVTPSELSKLIEDKLEERYRLRGGVKIVDSLPVTPSGKIYKLLLKNKMQPLKYK